MATIADWVEGARPRTLPAALAPVLAGTAAAHAMGEWHLDRALLALVVSLALQVGVNYANDYSDGIRGTDEQRVGPVRLVGQGLAPPCTVKLAAFACFGIAALAGAALVILSGQWWFIAVGIASIIAAWYYTGGKNPYGYLGLGEVFVFVFFGLVAVIGTTWTQAGGADLTAWMAAIGIGALACAILVANNIRDIPGDTVAGKRTLAVRLGDAKARVLYLALVAAPFAAAAVAAVQRPGALLALVALIAAIPPARAILRGATGRDLIAVLGGTGRLELLYAIAFSAGIILWG